MNNRRNHKFPIPCLGIFQFRAHGVHTLPYIFMFSMIPGNMCVACILQIESLMRLFIIPQSLNHTVNNSKKIRNREYFYLIVELVSSIWHGLGLAKITAWERAYIHTEQQSGRNTYLCTLLPGF